MDRLTVGAGHVAVHQFSTVDRAIGRCLLVPPFQVPAEVLAPVGSALADQGFEVFAIDPRNHLGDGSGTITDFRLSTFAEDCRAAVQAIRPTCLVAVSLGARAAMRALADGPICPSAVLVTPVVDVRATLIEVLGRDWFEVPAAEVPPLVPVLGVDINAPVFLGDAVANDFVDQPRTVHDLLALPGRLTMIPGTSDPWVDAASVARTVDRSGLGPRARVRWVDCDRHTFHEDPELALRIIGAMVDEVVDLHRPDVLVR